MALAEPHDVDAGGDRSSISVPAIPTEPVLTSGEGTAPEMAHGLSRNVVDRQTHVDSASQDRYRDGRGRIERVWIVGTEGKSGRPGRRLGNGGGRTRTTCGMHVHTSRGPGMVVVVILPAVEVVIPPVLDREMVFPIAWKRRHERSPASLGDPEAVIGLRTAGHREHHYQRSHRGGRRPQSRPHGAAPSGRWRCRGRVRSSSVQSPIHGSLSGGGWTPGPIPGGAFKGLAASPVPRLQPPLRKSAPWEGAV